MQKAQKSVLFERLVWALHVQTRRLPLPLAGRKLKCVLVHKISMLWTVVQMAAAIKLTNMAVHGLWLDQTRLQE